MNYWKQVFRFMTRCVLNGECGYSEPNLSCTISLLYHLAVTVVCFDEQTQLLIEIRSQCLEISLEFALALYSLLFG